MLFKIIQRALEVIHEDGCEVEADPVTDEDTLHWNVLAIDWQGVGWNLPAACSEAVGKVVQRVTGRNTIFHFPTDGRDSSIHLAIIDDLKRANFGDFLREELCSLIAGSMDFSIPLFAESEEIIVLANDRSAWPRKIKCDITHVAAEIIHPENFLRRKVGLVPPNNPANAQW